MYKDNLISPLLPMIKVCIIVLIILKIPLSFTTVTGNIMQMFQNVFNLEKRKPLIFDESFGILSSLSYKI